MKRRPRKLLRLALVGFAAASVLVPVAQAGPDDRPLSVATSPALQQRIVSPDDRPLSVATSPALQERVVSPDDRSVPFATPAAPRTTVQVIDGPSGFDWGDAGIGAFGAFALALLLGAMLLITVRHRHYSLAHD